MMKDRMKKVRFLALALAAILCFGALAGCTSNNSGGDTANDDTTVNAGAGETNAAGEDETPAEDEANGGDETPAGDGGDETAEGESSGDESAEGESSEDESAEA